MKPSVILRRAVLGLFLVVQLIVLTPQQATADSFDSMIWLLQKVEQASGPVFPISIQDIRASKGYINCLLNADNDIDVAICTDTFHDTALGQQAATATGIPSWFWDLLDLYLDIRSGDIWGAVEHLGKAALCLVAQVLAEGYDVCGLIEELAELGDTLLDAAAAVGEFLADAGEALADAASAVGCAVGLGGCDKPTPPEVRVYQWVFAPRLQDAIAAKKMVDATAYTTLFNQLKNNALQNPAIYSIPSQTVTMGPVTMVVPPAARFAAAAVAIAAGSFDRAVDANWSSYVATTALGELATQRHDYNNTNQLRFLVNSAAADFETLQRNNPNLKIDQKLPELLVSRCTNDFSETRKFAHVDRWLASHQAQAAQLGNPKTNHDWCTQLWEQNKQSFTPLLRQYAADHFCRGMSCVTIATYQSCIGLMGLVGQQGLCTPTNQVGREAANTISADLQRRGSRFPCSIRNDSKGVSPATVDLVCTRPTQGHACTTTYQNLFTGLPIRLVNCVVEERPDYAAQKNSFYATVKALQLGKRVSIALDEADPLVAVVDASKEELLAALLQAGGHTQQDPGSSRAEAARLAQNLRYEYQLNRTIDGENTPLYLRARGGTAPISSQQPGTAQQDYRTPVGGYRTPVQGGPAVRPGFDHQGGFTNPGNPYMQQNQAGLANAANQTAQHTGAAAQQAQTRNMPQPAPGKPDLAVIPQLSIGNSTAQWGGSVVLYAQHLQSAGNGLCSTTITYAVQNRGTAASPAYTSMLLNSTAANRPLPQQWSQLAQGDSQSRTEQLLLRPGQNNLTLYLDQAGQLDELSKANNQARLQIILNGTCQPQQQQYQPPQPVQQQPYQRQLPQPQLPVRRPGLF